MARTTWPEHLARTLGQNTWPEHLAGTLGQNNWPEQLARTIGQNNWEASRTNGASLASRLRELPVDGRERRLKWFGAAIDAAIFGPTNPNRRNADRNFSKRSGLPWAFDGGLRALLPFSNQG